MVANVVKITTNYGQNMTFTNCGNGMWSMNDGKSEEKYGYSMQNVIDASKTATSVRMA